MINLAAFFPWVGFVPGMPDILQQLKTLAEKKMEELRIPFSSVRVYGTPRRMAFIADDVAKAQADSTVESKGPSVKIAFGPDGTPSKAAIGFARGQGIDVKDLDTRGEYVYAVKHLQGKAVIELLPAMLDDIIHSLSFPKNMRWADYDFKFVRPIRWLVALLNDKVIPVEITDVKSGNKTMTKVHTTLLLLCFWKMLALFLLLVKKVF